MPTVVPTEVPTYLCLTVVLDCGFDTWDGYYHRSEEAEFFEGPGKLRLYGSYFQKLF